MNISNRTYTLTCKTYASLVSLPRFQAQPGNANSRGRASRDLLEAEPQVCHFQAQPGSEEQGA
ncbi:MAG: hypothetical protein HC899_31180 [Leptolyngbyaceae cyanobacterium SM1_4_3]|nr:hypothetical protein [Leptolyngbyaceae cyanobacterium SM1_4_3]